MRVGVIDVGTYSTRLTVAEVGKDDFKVLYEEGKITALGRGVKQTGFLSKEAIEETLEVIKRYKRICDELGVKECLVLGTEALRVAKNREEFERELERLGLKLRVISPEEEGRYAYLGAYWALRPKGRVGVVDQGGGSTEFVFGEGTRVEEVVSLPFGIVNLTEAFLRHDPPTEEELGRLIDFLDREIKKAVRPVDELVGLGGTITTIAALEYGIYPYDPSKVSGKTLTREQLKRWFERLSKMSVAERKRLPQIEDRRAEAIVPGVAIFWRTLELFGKDRLTVSDWSVKQGAIVANFLLKEGKKD
ncbi:MAG: Ppx/GppA family phosphatase [Aquificae bacterium]|nr:Ppx/GppA family phosphatase [Aquificota bacterium]